MKHNRAQSFKGWKELSCALNSTETYWVIQWIEGAIHPLNNRGQNFNCSLKVLAKHDTEETRRFCVWKIFAPSSTVQLKREGKFILNDFQTMNLEPMKK